MNEKAELPKLPVISSVREDGTKRLLTGVEVDLRNLRMYELFEEGYKKSEIGKHFGIKVSTVTAGLRSFETEWRARLQSDKLSWLNQEMMRLDNVERKAWELYDMDVDNERTRRIALKGKRLHRQDKYETSVLNEVKRIRVTILGEIRRTIVERCKLLGLHAIDSLSKKDAVFAPMLVFQSSRDAPQELLEQTAVEVCPADGAKGAIVGRTVAHFDNPVELAGNCEELEDGKD